jgi:hypothetical protein
LVVWVVAVSVLAHAEPSRCATARGCVDAALAKPSTFAQSLARTLPQMSSSERVVCLGFLDPDAGVQAWVRHACLGGTLDMSCSPECIERIVEFAGELERPPDEVVLMLTPLFDNELGRVQLAAMLMRDSGPPAAALAALWMSRSEELPMTARQRARAEALVWNGYYVEREKAPTQDVIVDAVLRNPALYRARVEQLIDRDLHAGKTNALDLQSEAFYLQNDERGRIAFAKKVLPLTRDLEPRIAEAACELTRVAFRGADLARWPADLVRRSLRALEVQAQTPELSLDNASLLAAEASALIAYPEAKAMATRLMDDPESDVRAIALDAMLTFDHGKLPEAVVDHALADEGPEVLAQLARWLPQPCPEAMAKKLAARLLAVDAKDLASDPRWQEATLAMGLELEHAGGPFHALRDEESARHAGARANDDRVHWAHVNAELLGSNEVQQALDEVAHNEMRRRDEEARRIAERGRRLRAARDALPR